MPFARKSEPPPSAVNEIKDLAEQLISRFGERATAYANHQALKARHSGDTMRMWAWRWIAGATVEILRSEPRVGG